MKVIKSLNNNMILGFDENGNECICQGKSIGFGKRKGDEVNDILIERRFYPENQNQSSHFQSLFQKIQEEYWVIAENTINYAQSNYGIKGNAGLLLNLSDHMAGSVERYQKGVKLTNPLLLDIKRLYPKEFKSGKFALKLLQEEFEIEMLEDEAAFLALHFINADLMNASLNVSVENLTVITNSVLQMIEQSFQITLDEEDWNYQRFLTHLKFFVKRVISGKHYEDYPDEELYAELKKKYPQVHNCVELICDYILIDYHHDVSQEERLYLLVHIERVTRAARRKK